MKKVLTILIFISLSFNLYSQTEEDIVIETMIQLDQYDEITKGYESTGSDSYSAKSLYSIGLAYYMLNDDANCLKLMDMSMAKDSTYAGAYYIKASALNGLNRSNDAIPYFKKAISIETDKNKLARIHVDLAWSYYILNQDDLAIETYNKLIEYDSSIALPYLMIAQIYARQNKEDKAMDTYRLARKNCSKDSDNYTMILYNIALDEQEKGNYAEAKNTYKEIISINPEDYQVYGKLIQIYNHDKEYDKIPSLKNILYTAHKENKIQDENLSDMFCIDQFMFKDKLIKVFERYQNDEGSKIYNKIIFYIPNDEGEIEWRIQTEYSPALISSGSGRYFLCSALFNHPNHRKNYGIVFNKDSTYEQIKNVVLKILEKEF